jgi:hypothetical protein
MAVVGSRPPEARPRSVAECSRLDRCPEVVAAARQRDITDIVHFTTVTGAVGVLASGAVKSRRLLPTEQYLDHIYKPNAINRSGDAAWHGYVNLSVSVINDWMFDSSRRWHIQDGVSWVVLSFDPEILGDPGVVFTTTNNIYPACRRAEGLVGFGQMFEEVAAGRYGRPHSRADLADSLTTDRQAEVLYPGELRLRRLQRIDVQVEEALDDIEGALGALGLRIPVRLSPETFE